MAVSLEDIKTLIVNQNSNFDSKFDNLSARLDNVLTTVKDTVSNEVATQLAPHIERLNQLSRVSMQPRGYQEEGISECLNTYQDKCMRDSRH